MFAQSVPNSVVAWAPCVLPAARAEELLALPARQSSSGSCSAGNHPKLRDRCPSEGTTIPCRQYPPSKASLSRHPGTYSPLARRCDAARRWPRPGPPACWSGGEECEEEERAGVHVMRHRLKPVRHGGVRARRGRLLGVHELGRAIPTLPWRTSSRRVRSRQCCASFETHPACSRARERPRW